MDAKREREQKLRVLNAGLKLLNMSLKREEKKGTSACRGAIYMDKM